MGSCTSTPNTPIGIPTIDENTFRIRQLDDRMRKKSGMILRLTNDMLIIEQRGRRHKPELSASLFPDKTKYSIQRYGVPDIKIPSILIDLKGYNGRDDSKYVFYCKENTRLYEKLRSKIDQAAKRTSSIQSMANGHSRVTPLPTPTPSTPSRLPPFDAHHQNNPSQHTYANDPFHQTQHNHLQSSTPRSHLSTFPVNRTPAFQATPLSPVLEQESREVDCSSTFKLDRPPSNRAEMKEMRELKSTKSNPPIFDTVHAPWPKPPPRPNPQSLYQNGQSEMLSRTSLSTRSSGLNMNQLSARSDCEPLLLSNLSTPNNYNTRIPKMNSHDHIYVNTANHEEFPGPRTPSFGPYPSTAPPNSYSKRFFFPPMEEIKRSEAGSMNYVTVEHNSLSSSNSTPRTPKTPGTSVQYTPVDFQKTDELHRSQSTIRSDSKRKHLIQQK